METLVTPGLVVDIEKLKENVQEMISKSKDRGVGLRPHIKTHKTIEGAFYQIYGDDIIDKRMERMNSEECKITVSTLGEARFYADFGFQDILYAVPLSCNKLEQAYQLTRQIKHFHIMFDHPFHLQAAEEFWKSLYLDCIIKWIL